MHSMHPDRSAFAFAIALAIITASAVVAPAPLPFCRPATPSSNGTRSRRTRLSVREPSRSRASSTCRTSRPRSTTPYAIEHGNSSRSCRSSRPGGRRRRMLPSSKPHTARFQLLPDRRGDARPAVQPGVSAIPDGPGRPQERGRPRGRRPGISDRAGDGRMTPIATTSTFQRLRRPRRLAADPAFAAAQTPGSRRSPFILKSATQFLPPPPPALASQTWVDAFNEIKTVRRRNQHRPHGRADSDREVLDRERRPPVQRGRARDRGRPRSRHVGERPPDRNGQRDRRRQRHLGHVHQVPLPVLAPDHRHRPQRGTGRRLRTGSGV